MRYTTVAIQEGYRFGHFVKNISMTWIALGYVWSARLWAKLSDEQRSHLGGSWAFPLFTIIIVLLPFSTSTAGVERYAVTTLVGIWPLLFAHQIQDSRAFRRFERQTWVFSIIMCFMILFAFVTGYRHTWLLYF